MANTLGIRHIAFAVEDIEALVTKMKKKGAGLGRISPHNMKDKASKWQLLQYSLLRVDDLLHYININFLEQRSYSINSEEREKLMAVVAIYRKIHEEVESESQFPELVIDLLTEEIIIIDHHYSDVLENIKNE